MFKEINVINDRKRYQKRIMSRHLSTSISNNKCIKDFDKNKESSYLNYWDVNNLYGWAMSKKLSVNDFKCVEDISEFDESFIKSYNEESDKGYFLEVDIQYLENKHNLHNKLLFLSEWT